MTKPYTKQKLFYPPSSEAEKPRPISENSALPVAYLDKISYFETLRAYAGNIFCLDEHLERLAESCQRAGQSLPSETKTLGAWLQECLKESGYADSLLRISLQWDAQEQCVAVCLIRPFHFYPEALYEKGVKLEVSTMRRWTLRAQDPQIKSSQFVTGVLAFLDKTGSTDAHELLLLGQAGTVAEGTTSNIFLVKGKRVLTPHAASGILKGVTRRLALDLAKKRGFEAVETFLTRHEIYTADECFMTNTSSEILPVVEVDKRTIGSGQPGPTTQILRQDFKETVKAFIQNGKN